MKDKKGHPRFYISYSQGSPEDEKWVLGLASELRDSGVDVILDLWDLPEGQDRHAFMEEMIVNPKLDKIAIICDKDYIKKAEKKGGRVDKDSQIISAKLFEKGDPKKFIAVVREKDTHGNPLLPAYYQGKRHVDFSEAELFSEGFDQLLRWIYDQPLFLRPTLGKKPSYFTERKAVSIGNPLLLRTVLEALRCQRSYAGGALNEYFDDLLSELDQFKITDPDREFDEILLNNIEQFIPTRNDLIKVFRYIAMYEPGKTAHKSLRRFFEGLAAFSLPPDDSRSYKEWDFDNFKFIVQELFLYSVASLLQYERFDAVAGLLGTRYLVKKKAKEGKRPLATFNIFRHHLQSLDYRNERLALGHASLHGELMKKRCSGIEIDFEQLMQADFVLYLRDGLDALKGEVAQRWWPETLLYRIPPEETFEIFARGESKEYFDEMKGIFGIQKKEEFEPLLQAIRKRDLFVPQWDDLKIMPARLISYDRLTMRP